MTGEKQDSGDLLGIRPYGEAAKVLTQGVVDGAAAFLGRICLPAAKEFGLLLRDKITEWRARNVVAIVQRTEALLKETGGVGTRHAHPRLVLAALEHGSWANEPDLQDMWAGLLASSCTTTGKDQTNLMFMNTLSQITTAQARIVKYSCENATKTVTKAGLIWRDILVENVTKLMEVSGIENIHQLDRELDYLRHLDLIEIGIRANDRIPADKLQAIISPSAFALHLYVKCQGSLQSPVEYFNVERGAT